jgi:hypothetical protein
MVGAHRIAVGIGIASTVGIGSASTANIGIVSMDSIHNHIHIETFVLHQLRTSRSAQIKAVPNFACMCQSNCVKWQQSDGKLLPFC